MTSKSTRVYCYQFGSENCYKVGHTKNPPEMRMRGLATGSPVKLKLYRDIETEDALHLEKYILHLLDAKRAENGEFFRVTREELNDAINQAVAFIEEYCPKVREAEQLKGKKPNDTMLDPSDEIREIYRQLREANRERFLLEMRINLLQSKVKVVIGEGRGIRGVASWDWVEKWTMDTDLFKKEHQELYDQYKRDSSYRRFRLDGSDLTK